MALRVSAKIFKFSVASQCGLCRKVLDRIKVRGLLKESSASKISDFKMKSAHYYRALILAASCRIFVAVRARWQSATLLARHAAAVGHWHSAAL